MGKTRVALQNVTHSITGLFYPAGTDVPVDHLSDAQIQAFESQGVLAQRGDPRILAIGVGQPAVVPEGVTLRPKA
jgi:hypothetical protein